MDKRVKSQGVSEKEYDFIIGNYQVYRKLFMDNNNFVKMDPSARKLQEPRN